MGPISIELEYASYSLLTINLSVFNNLNNIVGIYPKTLLFENGKQVETFYILSHYSSKAS